MKRSVILSAVYGCMLASLSACSVPAASETVTEPFLLVDQGQESVSAEFSVTIDPNSNVFELEEMQAREEAATVSGDGPLQLRALAKKPPALEGKVWVELWVINPAKLGLRDTTLSVTADDVSVVDVTADPYETAPLNEPIALGGIGPEGIGRAAILLDSGSDQEIRLSVSISGTSTSFHAASSGPIAISPDGTQVWTAVPDADAVVVVNANSLERIETLSLPGHPKSVAIAPDGKLAFVTLAHANALVVFDTERREEVQRFSEEDGLGRELRHVVASPNGRWVFTSAYVTDTIARFERRGDRLYLDGQMQVGRRPMGLSLTPQSDLLMVSQFLPRGPILSNEAWITSIDPATLEERDEIVLMDEFNLEESECLADVFGVSPIRVTMEGVASQLAGVFIEPGGGRAWTAGIRVSPTPVIEAGPNALETVFNAVEPGRFAPGFLFVLDTRNPLAPHRMLADGAVDPPDVNVEYVQCVKPGQEIEVTSRVMLDDHRQVNLGPVAPTGISGLTETGVARALGFTRGSRRVLSLSYIADELMVVDTTTQHPSTQKHFQLSGSNPVGIVVTPDGERGFVTYENSLFLSVLDLSAYAQPGALPEPGYVPYTYADIDEFGPGQSPFTRMRLVRTITDVPERPAIEETDQVVLIDEDPLDEVTRKGRIYFTSSNPDKYPELSTSRQAACATCHPDGGQDGSVWATMEGERRTMSLRGGVLGRGWLHASGTHRDAKEFVEIVVHERLGGVPSEETVDILAKHLAEGIPRLQPPPVDAALAKKGAELFATYCASCHQGDHLTSGRPVADEPMQPGAEDGPALYDVGTVTDYAGALLGSYFESIFPELESDLIASLRGDRALGPGDLAQEILDFRQRPARAAGEFKAPSLLDSWNNVVFLHDGSEDTLQGAIETIANNLAIPLAEDDVLAIVEYMKDL